MPVPVPELHSIGSVPCTDYRSLETLFPTLCPDRPKAFPPIDANETPLGGGETREIPRNKWNKAPTPVQGNISSFFFGID